MSELRLIETDRLVLEGWREDQLGDLVRLHGDPDTARYLSATGAPWGVDACRASIAQWIELFETKRLGKLRAVRKSDGVLIGRAGFSFYPPTGDPELGFAIFPEFRGLGFASEAAQGLVSWLFHDTSWQKFMGFADIRNTASLAVLQRIGMRKTHIADFHGMTCQFHILEKADS